MTLSLLALSVLLALSLAAAVVSEVRRQRREREHEELEDLADALRADVLKMLAERNADFQRGHVAGVRDALAELLVAPRWRVVVSMQGKTLRASQPMPHAAALVLSSGLVAEAPEGAMVEVEEV